MKMRLTVLITAVLIFAGIAQAQAYSAPAFTATFNGPVTVEVTRNTTNTSTNTHYTSDHAGVYQTVSVRAVDHDIAVSQATLDFYAAQAHQDGETLVSTQNGVYQGHIFTYLDLNLTNPFNKETIERRMWIIIVNPRTAIFIMLDNPLATPAAGAADWTTLANSLVIK